MTMSKVLTAVALGHLAGLGQSAMVERQSNDTLGRTPYMGWSSWVRTPLPQDVQ
ncbi:hypothetical protein IMZ48_41890 [Candidatus Bathyarchaeota archaeon]|nr:hypothetical protein [Candidatus Bathyarchaeota archaeon]